MRRTLALGLLLACSAPAWAWAAMPGQSCDQIGASQMSDDQQSIVVCLKTSSGRSSWQSMSSGGGVTGGCAFTYKETYYHDGGGAYSWHIDYAWGKGCQPTGTQSPTYQGGKVAYPYAQVAADGYECGPTAKMDLGANAGGTTGGNYVYMQCVSK
jgi:hypothetical protein